MIGLNLKPLETNKTVEQTFEEDLGRIWRISKKNSQKRICKEGLEKENSQRIRKRELIRIQKETTLQAPMFH